MAGESIIQVNSGSGPKVHTFQRTIGANNVEDTLYIPGEAYLATYTVVAAAVSGATGNSHMMQIMAGSSLNVAIRSIRITQIAAAGAVAGIAFQIWRLTSAGTGGTAITPGKFDNGDAAAGATGQTLPTVKGAEGVQLWQESLWAGTAAIPTATNRLLWDATPDHKSIVIPSGTANGIAIKNTTALATATWDITVEFVERNF